jgi:uncharacterized protein DUF4396
MHGGTLLTGTLFKLVTTQSNIFMDVVSLNRMAIAATLHCLTGCAIGEVLGMVIGTATGLDNFQTILLAIALAFLFGYTLSILPLIKGGVPLKKALTLVLLADTLSIATMEVVDNLVVIFIPGAMDAGLNTVLFWTSLALSLVVAFFAAVPVNRYLLTKNKGHALTHQHRSHH